MTPLAHEARIGSSESAEPSTFYDRHQATLQEMFAVLQMPDAGRSLGAAVEATQPWVQGDHHLPEYVVSLSGVQSAKLATIYDHLGIIQPLALPEGHYDHLLMLGGIHDGNKARLEFIKAALQHGGVTSAQLDLLGGERQIYDNVEAAAIAEDIAELAKHEGGQEWLEGLQSGERQVVYETDSIRLAAAVHLGRLARVGKDIDFRRDSSREHIYKFTWDDLAVTLLHTRAVARPKGKPRHTTEACVRDWVRHIAPETSAYIGFVARNPHIERVTRVTCEVIKQEGRRDIEVVQAGPAAQTVDHSLCMGEVARNLFEDTL